MKDNVTKCIICGQYFVEHVEGEGEVCDKCRDTAPEQINNELLSKWQTGEHTL